MNRTHHQQGFTLLEMMIALLIGATIVSPMYVVTRAMSQQTDTGRMEVEAMQRARMGVDSLLRDLAMTGLSVSPNTEVDDFAANRNVTGSTAQYRNAVVHLNRGAAGNDAIMLTGNFLGGDVYAALISGTNQINFIRTDFNIHTCSEQFNAEYSHAHMISATGDSLDAKVESVSYDESDNTCTITVRTADLTEDFGSEGETVFVSSNQTALYWVETQDDHDVLVRYYVDFYSASSASDSCTVAPGTTDVESITLPGNSAPVVSTRIVIAEYVEDFQVWFRPATRQGTTDWISPHHHPVRGGAGVVDESSGNFPMGFVLTDEAFFFPRDASGDTVANLDNLSCADTAAMTVGAEHVRSAMVRLTVRTEMTDQSIDALAFDTVNERVAKYTIKGYETPPDGVLTDKLGTAYKLKTLITEVSMPNLAARPGLAKL